MFKLSKLVLFIVLVIFAVPFSSSAQDVPVGNGLSISPTRTDITLERGESDVIKLFVENISDADIIARAFLNDFEPDENTGNPKLIVGSDIVSSSSLREFVTNIEDVPIKAGETAIVDVFVQVPSDAAPGAYYGAVRFIPTSGEGEQDTQLSLNASVASLLLIEVPGDIKEQIEITDVGAFLDKDIGSFFTVKPDQIGVEIKNLGNGFSKPFGTVIVSGPWGSGEVMSYEINDSTPRGNVLPESRRLFLEDIENDDRQNVISWPGRYTILGNISHGNGGEIIEVKASFWYMPTWFIIVIFVIALILVGTIFFIYRRYNTKKTSRSRR